MDRENVIESLKDLCQHYLRDMETTDDLAQHCDRMAAWMIEFAGQIRRDRQHEMYEKCGLDRLAADLGLKGAA